MLYRFPRTSCPKRQTIWDTSLKPLLSQFSSRLTLNVQKCHSCLQDFPRSSLQAILVMMSGQQARGTKKLCFEVDSFGFTVRGSRDGTRPESYNPLNLNALNCETEW